MMPINQIQVELFRHLLDELATDHICTETEAYEMHTYLFEEQVSYLFKKDSPLGEVASYLREMIVGQGFSNLEELLQYFAKEGEKMDLFLDALPSQVPAVEVMTEQALAPWSPLEGLNCISHSGATFYDSSRAYSRMSATIVNQYNELHEACRQDWSKDIYTTIRDYFHEQLKEQRDWKRTFVFDFGAGYVIGRSYLEKFTGKLHDQVTVLASMSDGHTMEIPSSCRPNTEWQTMRDWVMHYYNDRQAPDYDGIINVVRQEKPISDSNFKTALFEWWMYSKLFISNNRVNPWQQFREQLFSNCFPALNFPHTIYYSGHGFRAWLITHFERYLSRKKWSILKATRKNYWLTSDDPGFMFHLREWDGGKMTTAPPGYSLTEIRMDTILYYPLTKEYCLRVEPLVFMDDENLEYPDSSIRFEQSTKEEVDFVNEMTVSTRQEMVIGTDTKTLNQYKQTNMAKNGKIGDGHRNGQVKERSQTHNPKTDTWVKRDTNTGRFMDGKADDKPFKGVRKEK